MSFRGTAGEMDKAPSPLLPMEHQQQGHSCGCPAWSRTWLWVVWLGGLVYGVQVVL